MDRSIKKTKINIGTKMVIRKIAKPIAGLQTSISTGREYSRKAVVKIKEMGNTW